ncbi:MAG: type II toxin-antitoxin system VapC family toxin [Thauera sp.]
MALYADTCILLPLFFRDTSTEAVLAWLGGVGNETVLISQWTRTEFASAAGIMARRGDISADLHREGLERFDRLVSARLSTELVDTTDFDRARSWIADYRSGLRAGDALHLAVCARLSARLCTADGPLARAAADVGVAVQKVA